MTNWIFEPGHTSAEFIARHMMVSNVRGHFTDVDGQIDFDPDHPAEGTVEARIDASTLWSGNENRDEHLLSEDFLYVEQHPTLTYEGEIDSVLGRDEFRVAGELTLRGVTRDVPLRVHYQGSWETPYWTDGENKGPIQRLGFEASTTIDRREFGVSWNDTLDRGGVVVSNEIEIKLDVECLESEIV